LSRGLGCRTGAGGSTLLLADAKRDDYAESDGGGAETRAERP